MKTDLNDVTFLIPVRLDSIQRLENILMVIKLLRNNFNTHIYVRETGNYSIQILSSLLKNRVQYEFIEDKDDVFYRTKHINQMVFKSQTPFIAIWDTDIVIDKSAIVNCVNKLRNELCDVAFPYNGECYDVHPLIKSLFFSKRGNLKILYRHKEKMNLLFSEICVGGAIILNKYKFIQAGCENEKHYGWCNEDHDRFYRFGALGYSIFRTENPLFHLSHPRFNNSNFANDIMRKKSYSICYQMKHSSKQEIEEWLRNRT